MVAAAPPHLGRHLRHVKEAHCTDACTLVLIAAIHGVESSRCLSADRAKEHTCMCAQFPLALKKNKIMSSVGRWVEAENRIGKNQK